MSHTHAWEVIRYNWHTGGLLISIVGFLRHGRRSLHMASAGTEVEALCRRVALEGLAPFRPAAYGVHRILARKKLLIARAHTLPGYEEM